MIKISGIIFVVVLGIIVVLYFLGSSRPLGSNWKLYTFAASGFSASFPSEPEIKDRGESALPNTAILFHSIGYATEDSNSNLTIMLVQDYYPDPNSSEPPVDTEKAITQLLNNKDTYLNLGQEFKLINSSVATYQGYPVFNYSAERTKATGEKSWYSARTVVVNNTAYTQSLVCATSCDEKEVNLFFDSLKLINK